jgi:hypothetical protein
LSRFICPFPAYAIHDLGHLAPLSDAPDLALSVSERSLYILQNLVDREATWASRYAVALVNGGYNRVEEEDDEYALYLECVEGLQREVIVQRMEWQTWLPRLWQPATTELSLVQVEGYFLAIDPILHFYAHFTLEENGASGRVIIRLPTDYPPFDTVGVMGTFLMRRSGLNRAGWLRPYVSDTSLQELWVSGEAGIFGQSPSFALAAGDEFALFGFYRIGER